MASVTTLFEARFAGNCSRCGDDIKRGDKISYSNGVLCADCTESAGTDADYAPDLATRGEVVFAEESPIRLRDVMPRGKTADDVCNRCFLIHSPSQMDCE